MVVSQRFELWEAFTSSAFKTGAFDRSATSPILVGESGFEPKTYCTQNNRSTTLSYTPICKDYWIFFTCYFNVQKLLLYGTDGGT